MQRAFCLDNTRARPRGETSHPTFALPPAGNVTENKDSDSVPEIMVVFCFPVRRKRKTTGVREEDANNVETKYVEQDPQNNLGIHDKHCTCHRADNKRLPAEPTKGATYCTPLAKPKVRREEEILERGSTIMIRCRYSTQPADSVGTRSPPTPKGPPAYPSTTDQPDYL